jgi:hypothetical protein
MIGLGLPDLIVMCKKKEEENIFILQDVPQGKPGYGRLFGRRKLTCVQANGFHTV